MAWKVITAILLIVGWTNAVSEPGQSMGWLLLIIAFFSVCAANS